MRGTSDSRSLRRAFTNIPHAATYSPAGNPGKRDLIIQCQGWTLAVIEAVICRDPIDYQSVKNDLTSHFQRLLGYFPGSLFFHLTYSYVEDPASVLGQLKQIAETGAPAPFTYKGIIKDLEPNGSLPRGFVAEYEVSQGRQRVVFLTLDMRQFAQREAAKAAANRPAKPRVARKKKAND